MIVFDECGDFRFENNFKHMRRTMRFNEIILMRKGVMHININGAEITAKENDVVFIPANCHHYGSRESCGEVNFFWVHFLTEDTINLPVFYHLDSPQDILQLFRQVFHFASISGSDADCSTTLLVHALERECSGLNKPIHTLGSTICDWIKRNFSEDINVKTLSDRFGYSSDYISTMVKMKTGMSAKNYITFCRIAHAKQHLVSSDLPIDIISRRCGFSDSKAFFKIFKKHEGITPSQYRKTYPNADDVGISTRRIENA